jgi:hypothetical protein
MDHFLMSISTSANLPPPQRCSTGLSTHPSLKGPASAQITALRNHLRTFAANQGVSLGAITAKAVLRHIASLQSRSRSAMEGGDDNDGEGAVGLLTTLGELFLRDAANSIATTKKTKHKSSGASARITAIKEVLASENERFVDWDQHDSHELVMCLLSAVSSRLNTGTGVGSTSYEAIDERRKGEGEEEAARRWWRKVSSKDESFVTNMFRCLTRTKTVCGKCGKVSLNFDPIMEVQISLSEASIEKAQARKLERIAASMGGLFGSRPTPLQKMIDRVQAVRDGGGGSVSAATNQDTKEGLPPPISAEEQAEEGADASEPQKEQNGSDDGPEDDAAEVSEPQESSTPSTLSKKDKRALKKAEKERVKHERNLKKLKLDNKPGKGKPKKAAAAKATKSATAAVSCRDDDDGLVCLEDLLHTQLSSFTEVEGFKCEGCGAVSASTPASPPPARGFPSTAKKGGKSQPKSTSHKKQSKHNVDEDDSAAASAAAACSSSSGTTTVISHDLTHYPPFLLVHLLRFDYEGDKVRVPVRLCTSFEQVVDHPTSTIRPTTSALLSLPPRPSTTQLSKDHGNASSSTEALGTSGSDSDDAEHQRNLESIYEVIGVVRHHGRSLSYGHYTSSVKAVDFFDTPIPLHSATPEALNEAARWYQCDDADIDAERVARGASSGCCWTGGDRDAYMVVLRSIRYHEAGTSLSHPGGGSHDDDGDDEAAQAPAGTSHL